jgi:hypothetical protein
MSVGNLRARRIRRRFGVVAGVITVTLVVITVTLVVLALGSSPRASTSAAGQLGSGRGGYPRVIRLAHSGPANGELVASVTTSGGVEAIFRSTDDGVSFHRVGSIAVPAGERGQCCGSLYELPRRIGTMREGTLLFAASYGHDSPPMSIRLSASTDHGGTWHPVSSVVTAAPGTPSTKGLWEPEISVDRAGELVVYFSDETQPGHSQALMERISANGRTWSRSLPVVELPAPGARPGMAIVNALPDGTLFMTYELCGAGNACVVHERTSHDGVHWGNPAWPGRAIIATNGDRLSHTPNTTVINDGLPDGEIMLVGRDYDGPGNQPTIGDGDTLLVNRDGGAGHWIAVRAPVSVSTAAAKCANYSSSLLTIDHATRLLEIAQVAMSPTSCSAHYATERLPTLAQPGKKGNS